MQLLGHRLLFSPSDLSAFLACRHLTRLQLAVARGEIARPTSDNPQGDLIRRKGDEHEAAYLEALVAAGTDVVTVVRGDREADWDLEQAAHETQAAMRDGAEVIFQGVLLSPDGWRGFADFLERVDEPSALGPWSYEVADTKLARHPKPYHLLQLCFYSQEVARLQGHRPGRMHLVLGSGERESFRPADFEAYFRRVRGRFLEWVAAEADIYPVPVDHCPLCEFLSVCKGRWETDDHLSLVARMRRDQIARLEDAGVARLDTLAVTPAGSEIPRMAPATFEQVRRQAELQLHERRTGTLRYELLPHEEKRGLAFLPKPSAGDVFFDIEGDPWWAPDRGLEYLFGVLWREGGGTRYRAFWAHDREEEQRALEELVDFFHERLRAYPDMHVYHYAPYETTALKRLMGEYGTREDEVDDLLRRETFVDLYAVVRQGLLASLPGYGLKEMERFYFAGREADVTSGGDSVVDYERWIETREQSLLDGIAVYNEEDCRSTLELRDWLLDRRAEAQAQWGMEIDWRAPPEAREPTPESEEAQTEKQRLQAALLERSEAGDPLWLLAQLLDYHQREAKPVWWWFFKRMQLTSRELVNDSESIGELTWDGAPPEESGKALVHSFSFPDQEHRQDVGDSPVDPLTGKAAGAIVELDNDAQTLKLRRGESLADVSLPRALIPGGPYRTPEQQAALRRLARSVVDGTHRYRGLELLLRRDLPLGGLRVQRETLAEMRELVDLAWGSYLFVQGPPGSGKTYTGARLIVHLLERGWRVGVTSTSHKAIHNLLTAVEEAAEEAGVSFVGLKKCSSGNPESRFEGGRFIGNSDKNEAFTSRRVKLVAGTSWLFAREELDQTVDYLFVDEAGQVSLADALAVGTSARTLVLLGDPLQLAQVTQGVHPGESGASVLGHLLGDAPTVPEDRGLFLAHSYRMHPDVSRFVSQAFYAGRLDSAAECARQALEGGTGIRWLPVEHEGNRQLSPEEADAIAAEVGTLLGTAWTNVEGVTRELAVGDVMVVAPYNMHVRCLRERLAEAGLEGVQVGTVDKFQGQEAPVVFFSMASSAGDLIPRGMEFLFSRHRLNVAVSRARGRAYLVCSPRLLEVECRTVEQMRLANALCLLVETAGGVGFDGPRR